MLLKRLIILPFFAFLISPACNADAFPPSSEYLGGPVLSFEVLGSLDWDFKSDNGFLIWGGMAAVFSPYGLDFNAGPELAMEFRHYFGRKENKVWAVSLYSGVAYNLIDQGYGAFVPGLKLTRKKSINDVLKLEPYLSLSYPLYFDRSRPLLPFLTFGYRIVFERKMNKK